MALNYTKSTSTEATTAVRWQPWLVAVAALLATAVFVLAAMLLGGQAGFPLDDAWIHQTYARSLAENGRLEFIPGVVSSGSTAPLWTLFLAIGYLIGIPFRLWAYVLGAICLAWLGVGCMALWRVLWPRWAQRDWLAGLVVVLTWPLIWAAASGMETLLFTALGITICVQYAKRFALDSTDSELPATNYSSHLLLGVLLGLLILTRPDGVVLVLLVTIGLGILGLRRSGGQVVLSLGIVLGTAVLTLIPYFAFNYFASGTIWPNTLYAKQTEYAVLLETPIVLRALQLGYFSFGGIPEGVRGMSAAHLLLLPGAVVAGLAALQADWQRRRLFLLLPLLWAGGHVVLYAWRLPVTYQHGRYLLAAMPLWVLFGLAGWLIISTQINHLNDRISRLIKLSLSLTFGLMFSFFTLLGAQAYASDVAFIENEMVQVAHWLAENSEPDALIASHDIGAIGYFAKRPILDLAGLISPEIIPLLNDEARLANYVLNSEATHLVTAPGWPYEQLVQQENVVEQFNTNYLWTQEQGSNNMSVHTIEQDR